MRELMDSLRELWDCALAPGPGFRARAERRPALASAVKRMLLARTGPALAGLVLGYLAFAQGYGRALRMEGPLWDQVASRLPAQVSLGDLRAALAALPPLPGLARVLPWLALTAPLGVLSLWLHDAVWDHFGLWLVRGLRGRRSFKATLAAEAEALEVGAVGALAGLLKYLPGAGLRSAVVLVPVGIWFWVLRGFALAARHGCPAWKGVLATLLHALLIGILVFGTLALFVALVAQELRMG